LTARHFHFSLIGGTALERPKTEFDAMRIGRTTWIGLTVAVVGWAMMLGEAGLVDVIGAQNPHGLPATFHSDFVDISKTVIFSGFGLALVGSLQTGFGALNRFFEAVLVRSGQKTHAQAIAAPPPSMESYRREEAVTPAPRIGRPYRTFADGSVEVETIVGNRRFRSMAEARDFI
jgi:hypothetical protein